MFIPATAHNPAASVLAQVPLAPANPSGRAEWSDFSDQPKHFASKHCEEDCGIVGGDGGKFYFLDRPPCVKMIDQAISIAPKEKPNVTLKNHCTYCESTTHKIADCEDFQRDYLRPQPP